MINAIAILIYDLFIQVSDNHNSEYSIANNNIQININATEGILLE
jgi:hypothetical protein